MSMCNNNQVGDALKNINDGSERRSSGSAVENTDRSERRSGVGSDDEELCDNYLTKMLNNEERSIIKVFKAKPTKSNTKSSQIKQSIEELLDGSVSVEYKQFSKDYKERYNLKRLPNNFKKIFGSVCEEMSVGVCVKTCVKKVVKNIEKPATKPKKVGEKASRVIDNIKSLLEECDEVDYKTFSKNYKAKYDLKRLPNNFKKTYGKLVSFTNKAEEDVSVRTEKKVVKTKSKTSKFESLVIAIRALIYGSEDEDDDDQMQSYKEFSKNYKQTNNLKRLPNGFKKAYGVVVGDQPTKPKAVKVVKAKSKTSKYESLVSEIRSLVDESEDQVQNYKEFSKNYKLTNDLKRLPNGFKKAYGEVVGDQPTKPKAVKAIKVKKVKAPSPHIEYINKWLELNVKYQYGEDVESSYKIFKGVFKKAHPGRIPCGLKKTFKDQYAGFELPVEIESSDDQSEEQISNAEEVEMIRNAEEADEQPDYQSMIKEYQSDVEDQSEDESDDDHTDGDEDDHVDEEQNDEEDDQAELLNPEMRDYYVLKAHAKPQSDEINFKVLEYDDYMFEEFQSYKQRRKDVKKLLAGSNLEECEDEDLMTYALNILEEKAEDVQTTEQRILTMLLVYVLQERAVDEDRKYNICGDEPILCDWKGLTADQSSSDSSDYSLDDPDYVPTKDPNYRAEDQIGYVGSDCESSSEEAQPSPSKVKEIEIHNIMPIRSLAYTKHTEDADGEEIVEDCIIARDDNQFQTPLVTKLIGEDGEVILQCACLGRYWRINKDQYACDECDQLINNNLEDGGAEYRCDCRTANRPDAKTFKFCTYCEEFNAQMDKFMKSDDDEDINDNIVKYCKKKEVANKNKDLFVEEYEHKCETLSKETKAIMDELKEDLDEGYESDEESEEGEDWRSHNTEDQNDDQLCVEESNEEHKEQPIPESRKIVQALCEDEYSSDEDSSEETDYESWNMSCDDEKIDLELTEQPNKGPSTREEFDRAIKIAMDEYNEIQEELENMTKSIEWDSDEQQEEQPTPQINTGKLEIEEEDQSDIESECGSIVSSCSSMGEGPPTVCRYCAGELAYSKSHSVYKCIVCGEVAGGLYGGGKKSKKKKEEEATLEKVDRNIKILEVAPDDSSKIWSKIAYKDADDQNVQNFGYVDQLGAMDYVNRNYKQNEDQTFLYDDLVRKGFAEVDDNTEQLRIQQSRREHARRFEGRQPIVDRQNFTYIPQDDIVSTLNDIMNSSASLSRGANINFGLRQRYARKVGSVATTILAADPDDFKPNITLIEMLKTAMLDAKSMDDREGVIQLRRLKESLSGEVVDVTVTFIGKGKYRNARATRQITKQIYLPEGVKSLTDGKYHKAIKNDEITAAAKGIVYDELHTLYPGIDSLESISISRRQDNIGLGSMKLRGIAGGRFVHKKFELMSASAVREGMCVVDYISTTMNNSVSSRGTKRTKVKYSPYLIMVEMQVCMALHTYIMENRGDSLNDVKALLKDKCKLQTKLTNLGYKVNEMKGLVTRIVKADDLVSECQKFKLLGMTTTGGSVDDLLKEGVPLSYIIVWATLRGDIDLTVIDPLTARSVLVGVESKSRYNYKLSFGVFDGHLYPIDALPQSVVEENTAVLDSFRSTDGRDHKEESMMDYINKQFCGGFRLEADGFDITDDEQEVISGVFVRPIIYKGEMDGYHLLSAVCKSSGFTVCDIKMSSNSEIVAFVHPTNDLPVFVNTDVDIVKKICDEETLNTNLKRESFVFKGQQLSALARGLLSKYIGDIPSISTDDNDTGHLFKKYAPRAVVYGNGNTAENDIAVDIDGCYSTCLRNNKVPYLIPDPSTMLVRSERTTIQSMSNSSYYIISPFVLNGFYFGRMILHPMIIRRISKIVPSLKIEWELKCSKQLKPDLFTPLVDLIKTKYPTASKKLLNCMIGSFNMSDVKETQMMVCSDGEFAKALCNVRNITVQQQALENNRKDSSVTSIVEGETIPHCEGMYFVKSTTKHRLDIFQPYVYAVVMGNYIANTIDIIDHISRDEVMCIGGIKTDCYYLRLMPEKLQSSKNIKPKIKVKAPIKNRLTAEQERECARYIRFYMNRFGENEEKAEELITTMRKEQSDHKEEYCEEQPSMKNECVEIEKSKVDEEERLKALRERADQFKRSGICGYTMHEEESSDMMMSYITYKPPLENVQEWQTVRSLNDVEDDQSLYIAGPGGSGKSTLVLNDMFKDQSELEVFNKPSVSAMVVCPTHKLLSDWKEKCERLRRDNDKTYNIIFKTFASIARRYELFKDGKMSSSVFHAFFEEYDVLLVDEVSMMDYKTLSVMSYLKNHADLSLKFVLIGDFCQIPPVRTVCLDTLEYNLKFADLADFNKLNRIFIRGECRFDDQNTIDVLNNFRQSGELSISQLGEHKINDVNINITYTNATRKKIIANKNKTFKDLAVGDGVYLSIPFSKTQRYTELRLYNGAKYIITERVDNMFKVYMANDEEKNEIEIPDEQTSSTIASSVACTTHKLQGATVDENYVIHDIHLMDYRLLYTALSRCTNIKNVNVGERHRRFNESGKIIKSVDYIKAQEIDPTPQKEGYVFEGEPTLQSCVRFARLGDQTADDIFQRLNTYFVGRDVEFKVESVLDLIPSLFYECNACGFGKVDVNGEKKLRGCAECKDQYKNRKTIQTFCEEYQLAIPTKLEDQKSISKIAEAIAITSVCEGKTESTLHRTVEGDIYRGSARVRFNGVIESANYFTTTSLVDVSRIKTEQVNTIKYDERKERYEYTKPWKSSSTTKIYSQRRECLEEKVKAYVDQMFEPAVMAVERELQQSLIDNNLTRSEFKSVRVGSDDSTEKQFFSKINIDIDSVEKDVHTNVKLVPGLLEIICSEQIDLKRLDHLILNGEQEMSNLGFNNDQIKSQMRILKKIKARVNKDGQYATSYHKGKQADGVGRVFADGGISLGSLKKDVRGFLASNYYHDVDMANAHPVILSQLVEDPPVELIEYVEKREEMLLEVMTAIHCPRAIAKKLFLIMMYGGNLETNCRKEGYNPTLLPTRTKAFANALSKIIEDMANYHPNIKSERADSSINVASVASKLIQEVENRLLYFMHKYMSINFENYSNDVVLCFDGIMIPKHYNIDQQTIAEMQSYIKDKTNYSIKLEIKAFSNEMFNYRIAEQQQCRPAPAIHNVVESGFQNDQIDYDELECIALQEQQQLQIQCEEFDEFDMWDEYPVYENHVEQQEVKVDVSAITTVNQNDQSCDECVYCESPDVVLDSAKGVFVCSDCGEVQSALKGGNDQPQSNTSNDNTNIQTVIPCIDVTAQQVIVKASPCVKNNIESNNNVCVDEFDYFDQADMYGQCEDLQERCRTCQGTYFMYDYNRKAQRCQDCGEFQIK